MFNSLQGALCWCSGKARNQTHISNKTHLLIHTAWRVCHRFECYPQQRLSWHVGNRWCLCTDCWSAMTARGTGISRNGSRFCGLGSSRREEVPACPRSRLFTLPRRHKEVPLFSRPKSRQKTGWLSPSVSLSNSSNTEE